MRNSIVRAVTWWLSQLPPNKRRMPDVGGISFSSAEDLADFAARR
ncbi:MAG: hypothetical protein ACT4P6_16380 [Gemmatimonadaceae bacterium]